MNILFTICGRAGSKGVQGKNTKMLCGQPIVHYTLAAYLAYLDRYQGNDICVLSLNTDSELLRQQVEATNIDYVFVPRKAELAGDFVSKKDVLKDTFLETEKITGIAFDIMVDLDLTSPIRTEEDIFQTIQTLIGDEYADIAYSVTNSRRSPYFNMVKQDEDGYFRTVFQSDFVARQQAPVCYDMNASIYAYRREYLLSDRIMDRNALIWVMDDTGVLDIDSEEDWELMQVIISYFVENKVEYNNVNKALKEIKQITEN